jgi:hypothetical protein
MLLVVPQTQDGHFPEGQFPPQESAKTIDRSKNIVKIVFIML